jgi:meiotically up-regulated gene 157 (Mug157) protein
MSLFSPETVERICSTVAQRVDRNTSAVFRRCFTDTLSTTIEELPDGTAFVVTGDIPAMWLRDSSAQLTPYLHFLSEDPFLADMVARVARRQLQYVLLDPYANAFNRGPSGAGHCHDGTNPDPWVWERKYEIDSLCYPIQLAHDLWAITGRTDHLVDFVAAAQTIISLWRTEQDHEHKSSYTFPRDSTASPDTLGRDGRDPAVARTGMTWNGFRPSDDACGLGFNIPGNMFAVVELTHIADIAAEVFHDDALAAAAGRLRQEIENGIAVHGVVSDPVAGDVYAYEVDGLGNYLLMDDANVPSLLSVPLLGWCERADPLYVATRAFVLSDANPSYHRGLAASGLGSPHTPPGTIWPIGLAVEGLTARSDDEKAALLATLVATDAGTGLMHESFDKDDPQAFTRAWFSWANAMFCELVLDVVGLRTYTRRTI